MVGQSRVGKIGEHLIPLQNCLPQTPLEPKSYTEIVPVLKEGPTPHCLTHLIPRVSDKFQAWTHTHTLEHQAQ